MMRIARVMGRSNVIYEVPMTAEQAAFFLRLAEFRAIAEPEITFHDVVAEWQEKQQYHTNHTFGSQREA